MNDFVSYTSKLAIVANGRDNSLAMAASKRHAMLDNLLAVIHKDGGHYIHKHGYKKAVEDAIEIVTKK